MRVVPSATLERICVSPRVKSAEPCTRGAMSTSHSIGRISSWARPSGRFLSTAIRLRMISLSSFEKAAAASACRSGSGSPSSPAGASASSTSSLTASAASWWASFSLIEVASSILAPKRERISSSRPASTSGASTSSFSLPALSASSCIAAQSFLISPWAMSRASRISASVTPSAPASTIRIASSVPATIRSSSSSSERSSDGLTTNSPSSLPTRTAPTWAATGIGEIARAAEAPFMARLS